MRTFRLIAILLYLVMIATGLWASLGYPQPTLGGGLVGTAGDITDIFGCATGDCSSITVDDGDLLDFSSCDPTTSNECLILPQNSSGCAGATTDGQVCYDPVTDTHYIGNGTSAVAQGSGSITLDQAFDNGKVIDGANSQANAFKVGDGTDFMRWYIDSNACVQECVVGGAPADYEVNVASGKNFILDLAGTDNLTISSGGTVTLGTSLLERKVKNIPLSICQVDGTYCTQQTDVAIGDFTYPWTVTCADNDAATITCEVPADPAWNETNLSIRMRGAHSGVRDGNVHADTSILCVGDSETLASVSFGTETALDVSNTGYADDDNVVTAITAQSVTGCSDGDTVLIRYQIDATGTTETNPTNLNWRWMDVYFSYNTWSN